MYKHDITGVIFKDDDGFGLILFSFFLRFIYILQELVHAHPLRANLYVSFMSWFLCTLRTVHGTE